MISPLPPPAPLTLSPSSVSPLPMSLNNGETSVATNKIEKVASKLQQKNLIQLRERVQMRVPRNILGGGYGVDEDPYACSEEMLKQRLAIEQVLNKVIQMLKKSSPPVGLQ